MAKKSDPFGTEKILSTKAGKLTCYDLKELEKRGLGEISRMPFSMKILLEAVLRQIDGYAVTEGDLKTLCRWSHPDSKQREIPFKPARVVMQDFTGGAGHRRSGGHEGRPGRPGRGFPEDQPDHPIDLVIDHSVQVDRYATVRALEANAEME